MTKEAPMLSPVQNGSAALQGLLALALFLGAVLLPGCLIHDPIRTGDRMPSFTLTDVDGNPTGTSLLKGKIIVLHLFSLQPAEDNVHAANEEADKAIEILKQAKANFTRDDVAFLSVGLASYFGDFPDRPATSYENRTAMVREFRDRHNATWPFASEGEPDSIYWKFRPGYHSISYITGKDGIIRVEAGYPEGCLEGALRKVIQENRGGTIC